MATYKVVHFDQSPAYVSFQSSGGALSLQFVLQGSLYLAQPGSFIKLDDGGQFAVPYVSSDPLISSLASLFSSLFLLPGNPPGIDSAHIFLFRGFYRDSVTHIEPASGDMVQYYAYVEYLAPWALHFGLRAEASLPEYARVYAQVLFPKDHSCDCNRLWQRSEK